MKSVDLMSLWAFVCSVHLCKSVRERKVLLEWKNTNHVNRKCQDILQDAPLYNREKAEFATRRGSLVFENMPFLPQEGRLLRARRAYTRMQNITRWFLVSYILGYRRCYLRVVRVFSMVGCKNISSFYWLVSGREVVWEVMPVGLLTFFVVSFSLTELTDLTELFHQRFEPTERLRHTEFTEASPPTPLRMERGVVCEVTPFGLLIEGDRLLNIWRTCRGISVITPLSIRRGAGGEASLGCKVLCNRLT